MLLSSLCGQFSALTSICCASLDQLHLILHNIDVSRTQQAPLITQKPGFSSFFQLPKLSCHDVEAIKIAFVSRKTIPNSHDIDKKACLLAIYDFIIAEEGIPFDHLVVQESPFILISPMRYVRAAQLTFDRECRFTWSGWNLSCWTGRDVILPEPSYITVGSISWTW